MWLLMWLIDDPDAIWERSLNELLKRRKPQNTRWLYVGHLWVPCHGLCCTWENICWITSSRKSLVMQSHAKQQNGNCNSVRWKLTDCYTHTQNSDRTRCGLKNPREKWPKNLFGYNTKDQVADAVHRARSWCRKALCHIFVIYR